MLPPHLRLTPLIHFYFQVLHKLHVDLRLTARVVTNAHFRSAPETHRCSTATDPFLQITSIYFSSRSFFFFFDAHPHRLSLNCIAEP